MAFSPDGKILASWDTTIKLWEFPGGQKVASTALEGHSDLIMAMAFSPDSKTLATSSKDQTFRIWDVVTGKNTATVKGSSVHVRSICFSPDGKTLAAGHYNILMLWDVASGKRTATLKGHPHRITAVYFYDDGKALASSSDSSLNGPPWSVRGNYVSGTSPAARAPPPSAPPSLVAVSPDGKTLASHGVAASACGSCPQSRKTPSSFPTSYSGERQ